MSLTAICLMGPTAAGKTALALRLSQYVPIEIVSIDSALVYCGMDIGTAKPSLIERGKVPHHLIDICLPDAFFSVKQCIDAVVSLIPEIYERGRVPILVGGTMMYFWHLQEGLSPLPEQSQNIREMLIQKMNRDGLSKLYQELLRVDPQRAACLHPHDMQRILRALEIFYTAGLPSELSSQIKQAGVLLEGYQLVLAPTVRQDLHQTINTRFHHMLEAGFLAEVEAILMKYPKARVMPSMRMVGYRQALAYLESSIAYDVFVEQAIIATRQFAKRQYTWLRRFKSASWVNTSDEALPKLIAMAQKILDNEQTLRQGGSS